MKALIGTKNPGKIEGAKLALEGYFDNVEIEDIKVSSDVRDQPVNDEIYEGAKNRVNNLISYAQRNNIEADYYMAIESGITNSLGKWVIINIAVIKDKDGYESWGYGPAFPVPEKYVQKIIDTDFGKVMDEALNQHDLSTGVGGVNYLTHENISRIDITKQAFIMALTQFVNKDLWKDDNSLNKGK